MRLRLALQKLYDSIAGSQSACEESACDRFFPLLIGSIYGKHRLRNQNRGLTWRRWTRADSSCAGLNLAHSSSDGGSCRCMSSDGNSSGVGCVDGGTGVPFSNALRRRPIGVLRATDFRPAALQGAVMRVSILRTAASFRTLIP